MTKSDWLDLTVLERQKYNHLSELMDLTRQLGEAIDRGDEVSVRILVSMRNDPLVGLEELKKATRLRTEALSREERERVEELNSGASPEDENEILYVNQAGSARRLWERVVELDQRLNRRMAGDDSFYAKNGK
jgi:sRNA-binding carbon storage regulator CsrA